MSPSIEAELRAAMAQAADQIQPRANLAERVRRASRRRRRTLTRATAIGVAAVTAAALVAAYAAGAGQRRPSTARHAKQPPGWQWLTQYGAPDLLAVGPRVLYVAIGDNPNAVLAAYDRASGRLIRRIGIPAQPSTLVVGPHGLVWLAFYPDSLGGGTGVWLLSSDLKRRSEANLGTRRYHGCLVRRAHHHPDRQ